MRRGVSVFRLGDCLYYADTCEPLKQAAARGELRLVARGRGQYPGPPFPAQMLPEVRSIGSWDADHDQSWGLDWHRNEGIEFTYLARGKVSFGVDGQRFLLKRGDLTVTRPWQIHRLGNPRITACRLLWLILDVGVRRPNQPWIWPRWLALSEEDIRTLTTLLSLNEQPVWSANEEVAEYFEQIIAAADALNESRLRLAISGLLLAVTELLHRHQPPLDKAMSSTARAVELFLAQLPELVDAPWSLDRMAEACGLGRSQFTTYCKALTNMSPIEYLTACRIRVATRLLASDPALSVTEIAYRCGFNSSQYFARVFRAYVGCAPRAYRCFRAAPSTPAATAPGADIGIAVPAGSAGALLDGRGHDDRPAIPADLGMEHDTGGAGQRSWATSR